MQLTTACTLLRGSSAIGGGDGIPDGKVLSCDFVGQGERVGLEYNGFFKGRSAGPRSEMFFLGLVSFPKKSSLISCLGGASGVWGLPAR